MQSVLKFLSKRASLAVSMTLFLLVIQQSCKKTNFDQTPSASAIDFEKHFFQLSENASTDAQYAVRLLKKENERSGFVNKLPQNCGLPVWDKLILTSRKRTSVISRESEDSIGIDTDIIIPLTITQQELSSILYAHRVGDHYEISLYDVNRLAAECHKETFTPGDIKKTENDLRLFFFFENRVFGTTRFYHIPNVLFPNIGTCGNDGLKTIYLGSDSIPDTQNIVPEECEEWEIWYNPNGDPCNCDGDEYFTGETYFTGDCGDENGGSPPVIIIYTYPTFPGGGGTTPGNPPGNTPGGGGGNCTTCPPPPTECRLPFYVEEPCPTNPVPPPYNPYSAVPLDLDPSITNNFPCFTKILDSIKGYANLNAVAQVALHEIFNVNKKIHLTFVADRNLTKDSLDGDTRTDSAFTTMNPDGTEGIDYYAKIRINYWVLKNSTQEYIAATILHEAIHAYINYKGQQYLNHFIDSTTFKSMFPLFWPFRPIGTRGNFNSFNERAQHEGMAANYINILAQALRSVNSNPLIRPGLRDSAYEAVSWGGLYETKLWTNMIDTAYRKGFNEVLRDTSLRAPLNVPGYPGYFMQDYRTLKAKAYCL